MKRQSFLGTLEENERGIGEVLYSFYFKMFLEPDI